MKKISILFLYFYILLSVNASGQDLPATGQSILLTFGVLGWQSEDTIKIKYSGSVSKEQIQTDMEALAKAHGWTYSKSALEIKYENGQKVGWQRGILSEKHQFNTDFALDFQVLQEQFPNAEVIIIDILGRNAFDYQGAFISDMAVKAGPDLDDQKWQNQFSFQKDWNGLSGYRIRYTLQPAQFSENTILPILKAKTSLSKTWLLKVVPLLLLFIFIPSATLYLFLRRGVSLNERGKVRLSPVKAIVINTQFFLIVWMTTVIGCSDVFSMLTQNAILGFIFGGGTVPILSYVVFLLVLHQYEKNTRGVTWSFRENLLTNLRMMVLGAPVLLLPFCFLVTQKIFPDLPFLLFVLFLLVQYAILTTLSACVMPLVLRWTWKGKPLKDEKLRHRLQQLADKAGIDCRNIVLLKTKSSKLGNAWVAGILAKWRSVFLTDYLLEHLTPDEIEAVFAHELGHLKHRHLLKQVAWIVLGFGGQLLLVRLSLFMFDFIAALPAWLYWSLFVPVNFGVILLLVQFGLMRFWRRMEFEADAYAVELTQQPTIFLQALRKLIQLNDAPEDLDTFNEMLSTHPNFKARADAIEEL